MEGGVVTSSVEGNSEGSSIRSTLKSFGHGFRDDLGSVNCWALGVGE